MTRFVVLLVLACVGVAQLRVVSVVTKCCCPTPSRCHCPDHGSKSEGLQLRACHRSTEITAGVELPPFTPVLALVSPPEVRVVITVPPARSIPSPSPVQPRPEAPS